MPITEGEWVSIRALAERAIAANGGGQQIMTARVAKVDPDRKVIYVPEFGDQPIPLVDFSDDIRSYDADVPVGTMMEHSDDVPPENYLLANGAAVSRSTYSELFNVIGTEYGVGDGTTTFNVPQVAVGGGGGGVEIYEQPGDPGAKPTGTIWIDTDEVPPVWEAQIPLVTVLPSVPFDGQEVYYQSAGMAGDGIVWHLRYRSANPTAYKWEAVGNQPIYAVEDAVHAGFSTGAYIETATPSITLPLAGDYLIEWGSRIQQVPGAGFLWFSSVRCGTTTFSDTWAITWGGPGGGATVSYSGSAKRRFNSNAAGSLVRLGFKNINVAMDLYARWITATPIRVG